MLTQLHPCGLLVGYLSMWSISIFGIASNPQMARKERAYFQNSTVCFCFEKRRPFCARNRRYPTKVCTIPYTEYHKLARTRIEKEVGARLWMINDQYIRVSSLRTRHLTGPQLASLLNTTSKTPVSSSTVKRWFQDAGLLGRLANRWKRLKWAKENRHDWMS